MQKAIKYSLVQLVLHEECVLKSMLVKKNVPAQ